MLQNLHQNNPPLLAQLQPFYVFYIYLCGKLAFTGCSGVGTLKSDDRLYCSPNDFYAFDGFCTPATIGGLACPDWSSKVCTNAVKDGQ
jgi:hypothetical protein